MGIVTSLILESCSTHTSPDVLPPLSACIDNPKGKHDEHDRYRDFLTWNRRVHAPCRIEGRFRFHAKGRLKTSRV